MKASGTTMTQTNRQPEARTAVERQRPRRDTAPAAAEPASVSRITQKLSDAGVIEQARWDADSLNPTIEDVQR